MARATKKQCYFAAWFALNAMNKKWHFYMPEQFRVASQDYDSRIRTRLVFTYGGAKENEAYSVQFVYGGGVRLTRLMTGGGEADIGVLFDSKQSFIDAMRTIVHLSDIKNRVVQ